MSKGIILVVLQKPQTMTYFLIKQDHRLSFLICTDFRFNFGKEEIPVRNYIALINLNTAQLRPYICTETQTATKDEANSSNEKNLDEF